MSNQGGPLLGEVTSTDPGRRTPQHKPVQARQQEGEQEEDEQLGSFQALAERRGKEKRHVGTSWCSALEATMESGFYF